MTTCSPEAAMQKPTECRNLHKLGKGLTQLLRDVWNREISRTMAYTTRNTVNRLAHGELHLNLFTCASQNINEEMSKLLAVVAVKIIQTSTQLMKRQS